APVKMLHFCASLWIVALLQLRFSKLRHGEAPRCGMTKRLPVPEGGVEVLEAVHVAQKIGGLRVLRSVSVSLREKRERDEVGVRRAHLLDHLPDLLEGPDVERPGNERDEEDVRDGHPGSLSGGVAAPGVEDDVLVLLLEPERLCS